MQPMLMQPVYKYTGLSRRCQRALKFLFSHIAVVYMNRTSTVHVNIFGFKLRLKTRAPHVCALLCKALGETEAVVRPGAALVHASSS